ncbi:hypothetical protein VP01_1329g6 [Puccinia sorghi]|uniref:Uncharacterized protein n=1 Tax=Puccinia sorghi TaxID=27349 RepID=A0A0L6VMP2_9BASI|nr:hypothetical protein VP01_1329g6 [Puccinia sorghi]
MDKFSEMFANHLSNYGLMIFINLLGNRFKAMGFLKFIHTSNPKRFKILLKKRITDPKHCYLNLEIKNSVIFIIFQSYTNKCPIDNSDFQLINFNIKHNKSCKIIKLKKWFSCRNTVREKLFHVGVVGIRKFGKLCLYEIGSSFGEYLVALNGNKLHMKKMTSECLIALLQHTASIKMSIFSSIITKLLHSTRPCFQNTEMSELLFQPCYFPQYKYFDFLVPGSCPRLLKGKEESGNKLNSYRGTFYIVLLSIVTKCIYIINGYLDGFIIIFLYYIFMLVFNITSNSLQVIHTGLIQPTSLKKKSVETQWHMPGKCHKWSPDQAIFLKDKHIRPRLVCLYGLISFWIHKLTELSFTQANIFLIHYCWCHCSNFDNQECLKSRDQNCQKAIGKSMFCLLHCVCFEATMSRKGQFPFPHCISRISNHYQHQYLETHSLSSFKKKFLMNKKCSNLGDLEIECSCRGLETTIVIQEKPVTEVPAKHVSNEGRSYSIYTGPFCCKIRIQIELLSRQFTDRFPYLTFWLCSLPHQQFLATMLNYLLNNFILFNLSRITLTFSDFIAMLFLSENLLFRQKKLRFMMAKLSGHYADCQVELRLKLVVTCVDLKLNNQPNAEVGCNFQHLSSFQYEKVRPSLHLLKNPYISFSHPIFLEIIFEFQTTLWRRFYDLDIIFLLSLHKFLNPSPLEIQPNLFSCFNHLIQLSGLALNSPDGVIHDITAANQISSASQSSLFPPWKMSYLVTITYSHILWLQGRLTALSTMVGTESHNMLICMIRLNSPLGNYSMHCACIIAKDFWYLSRDELRTKFTTNQAKLYMTDVRERTCIQVPWKQPWSTGSTESSFSCFCHLLKWSQTSVGIPFSCAKSCNFAFQVFCEVLSCYNGLLVSYIHIQFSFNIEISNFGRYSLWMILSLGYMVAKLQCFCFVLVAWKFPTFFIFFTFEFGVFFLVSISPVFLVFFFLPLLSPLLPISRQKIKEILFKTFALFQVSVRFMVGFEIASNFVVLVAALKKELILDKFWRTIQNPVSKSIKKKKCFSQKKFFRICFIIGIIKAHSYQGMVFVECRSSGHWDGTPRYNERAVKPHRSISYMVKARCSHETCKYQLKDFYYQAARDSLITEGCTSLQWFSCSYGCCASGHEFPGLLWGGDVIYLCMSSTGQVTKYSHCSLNPSCFMRGYNYVMLIHIISWSDFTICSSHSDKTSEHLISPVDHLLTNFDTANEMKLIRCALPGPDRLHMGQHTYIFTKQTTFTIITRLKLIKLIKKKKKIGVCYNYPKSFNWDLQLEIHPLDNIHPVRPREIVNDDVHTYLSNGSSVENVHQTKKHRKGKPKLDILIIYKIMVFIHSRKGDDFINRCDMMHESQEREREALIGFGFVEEEMASMTMCHHCAVGLLLSLSGCKTLCFCFPASSSTVSSSCKYGHIFESHGVHFLFRKRHTTTLNRRVTGTKDAHWQVLIHPQSRNRPEIWISVRGVMLLSAYRFSPKLADLAAGCRIAFLLLTPATHTHTHISFNNNVPAIKICISRVYNFFFCGHDCKNERQTRKERGTHYEGKVDKGYSIWMDGDGWIVPLSYRYICTRSDRSWQPSLIEPAFTPTLYVLVIHKRHPPLHSPRRTNSVLSSFSLFFLCVCVCVYVCVCVCVCVVVWGWKKRCTYTYRAPKAVILSLDKIDHHPLVRRHGFQGKKKKKKKENTYGRRDIGMFIRTLTTGGLGDSRCGCTFIFIYFLFIVRIGCSDTDLRASILHTVDRRCTRITAAMRLIFFLFFFILLRMKGFCSEMGCDNLISWLLIHSSWMMSILSQVPILLHAPCYDDFQSSLKSPKYGGVLRPHWHLVASIVRLILDSTYFILLFIYINNNLRSYQLVLNNVNAQISTIDELPTPKRNNNNQRGETKIGLSWGFQRFHCNKNEGSYNIYKYIQIRGGYSGVLCNFIFYSSLLFSSHHHTQPKKTKQNYLQYSSELPLPKKKKKVIVPHIDRARSLALNPDSRLSTLRFPP